MTNEEFVRQAYAKAEVKDIAAWVKEIEPLEIKGGTTEGASLSAQNVVELSPDGKTPLQQLAAIGEVAARSVRQDRRSRSRFERNAWPRNQTIRTCGPHCCTSRAR